MAKIFFKTFLDLAPLSFKYEFNGEETLNTESVHYKNGITATFIKGLENFQDTTINKNTSLTLTNLQPLSSIFKGPSDRSISHSLTLRVIPTDRDFYPYFLKKTNTDGFILQENLGKIIIKKEPARIQYDITTNTFKRSFIESTFFIQKIENSDEVEIFLEGKQVRVQKNYPYTVELRKQEVDYNELWRQRFYVKKEKDNSITIKVKTPEGFRFLAFTSDGILRATGNKNNPKNIHNGTSGYNDYVLYFRNVSPDFQTVNFYPTNNWVTYHLNP
jgi:hypothetical protein